MLLCALPGCSAPVSPAVLKAERALKEARSSVGGLRLRCTPEDAAVSLEGVAQGLCSDFKGQQGLRVPKGLLRLELTREGYWPYVTYIEADGATLMLEATLVPIASPSHPR